MLEANGRINLGLGHSVQDVDGGPFTMKKTLPSWSTSPIPRCRIFWPDLHRLRQWQGERPPRAGPGVDELLPALCFAARFAVRNHDGVHPDRPAGVSVRPK